MAGAQGFFVLQNLSPDTYTVSAESADFQVSTSSITGHRLGCALPT